MAAENVGVAGVAGDAAGASMRPRRMAAENTGRGTFCSTAWLALQ